jgi:hypothetical protein
MAQTTIGNLEEIDQDIAPEPPKKKSKKPPKESKEERNAQFAEMVEAATKKRKPTTKKASKESNDLEDDVELPFQVLGYTPERKIIVWHNGYLMTFTVSQLRSDEFGLFIDTQDKADKYKAKVIKEAREKGMIDETDPIKMGIWFIKGKWLIVSGKTAIEVSDGKINEINHPVYEGKIIKFSKPWLNVKKFTEKFGKSTLNSVYKKIHDCVSQWHWKEKKASEYMTAIIILIAFQHAMKWRPWVYISGETDSGKSLLLYCLELLYGDLIKSADKTTAHAIYQAVGNTSRILCLDEFEKSKHIPQVMEALKLMSRGGEKNVGTPGEKEISFLVHHMPILASIYTPATCLKDESQRNRLMQFELAKPKERTPPTLWTSEEAEELVAELLAAVIGSWKDIQGVADEITKNTKQIKNDLDGKIDDRTVQNFMYASAVLKLATGKDYTVPEWAKIEKKSDGHSIIETILFSKIKHENVEYFVYDLIDSALRRPDCNSLDAEKAKNALRLHGLTVVYSTDWFLAMHAENVTKHLLRGAEEYRNLDITMPLERLAGAVKKKATFGGNSSLASIQIPMTLVDELRGIAEAQ